ncbi:MAG: TlpA family protein disulfide reductase [Lachnospiraceae bacterium]|nr:TlpA family protein disulfide reductase [Lachnospiraceae bacterium]
MKKQGLFAILLSLSLIISSCGMSPSGQVSQSGSDSSVAENEENTFGDTVSGKDTLQAIKDLTENKSHDAITSTSPAEGDITGDSDDIAVEPTSDDDATGESTSSGFESSDDSKPFDPEITFTAYDVISDAVISENIFSGYKLTMVNFWEPWCGPCVREMPDLQELYVELGSGSGDYNIIGVYSTEDGAGEILNEIGTTYSVLQYVAEFDSLQSGYVPNTVFFDSQGHIVYSDIADDSGCLFIGSRTKEDWNEIINYLSTNN